MELTVAGKVIGTTEQHPFHVKDRGWVAANELSPGDLLTTDHVEFFAVVEATALTDRVVPVYNLSLEHDHTYFVSYDDWDFGVWAHNAYRNLNSNKARSTFGVYEIFIDDCLHKIGKTHMGRVTQSTGLPTRLHQQLRKLSGTHPAASVTYSLTSLGRTTTRKAKLVETARLPLIWDDLGFVPLGNIKSFFPQ